MESLESATNHVHIDAIQEPEPETALRSMSEQFSALNRDFAQITVRIEGVLERIDGIASATPDIDETSKSPPGDLGALYERLSELQMWVPRLSSAAERLERL